MNESRVFGRRHGKEIVADELLAENCLGRSFDLAICASSPEPRALSVPRRLASVFRDAGTVICFNQLSSDRVRQSVDSELRRLCRGRTLDLDITRYDEFLQWFAQEVRRIWEEKERAPEILIDYSCLPKAYYVGVLSAATHTPGCRITYFYDTGKRPPSTWGTSEVDLIYALPGFEGCPNQDGRQAYLFSLGFDGHQTAAIEEVLQPRELYALVADPGVEGADANRAERANREILASADGVIRSAVDDVIGVVSRCRDVVGVGGEGTGLVVVPVGPKPHALALGIVALLEDRVTYLHVLTRVVPIRRIEASGKYAVTRVDLSTAPG